MTNVAKSKMMICQAGTIWLGMSEDAVGQQSTGKGVTYQERLLSCLTCPDCGLDLTTGAMAAHQICLHGAEPEIEWDRPPVSPTEHPPQVFEVSFPRFKTKCQCPFPGCPWSSLTWIYLINHFTQKHQRESLLILKEHPLPFPHSERYGRQVTPWILNNRYYTIEQCRIGEERRWWQENLKYCFKASKVSI